MMDNSIRMKFKHSKKIHLIVVYAISILLWFLGALIYQSARWVLKTWSNLSVEEIIFHLKVPIEGTNSDLISDYMNECLAIAIMALFFVIIVCIGIKNKKELKRYALLVINVISIFLITISIRLVWKELNVGEYIKNQKNTSTFIQENYVDPRSVEIKFPNQKRNLIYIFLESMENTYMDKKNGGAFEDNYIQELSKLELENINFSNADGLGGGFASTGATWTMGGVFAQSSGLPLKIPVDSNAMSEQDTFFPDIITLGDILEKENYRQVFVLGSDAVFGGRKNYFMQHGNYEIDDYYQALETGKIPEGYSCWWGFEDAKLFEFAKEQVLQLEQNTEPFNLTLLTADTHAEDGFFCQLCTAEYGDDQYANVLSCSSKQVSEFITWLKEQDCYDNTSIVLVGDHLTMDSNFCEGIDEEYERTVYNAFINAAYQPIYEKNRIFTTMDLYPTTLASLGVTISGDKLGLGTNLFSDKKTLAEKVGLETLNIELEQKSEFFDKFTKDIVIDNSLN